MGRSDLVIQFYRDGPGDVAAQDFPYPGKDIATARKVAEGMLLSYSRDQNRPAHRRPRRAHLRAEDGSIHHPIMVNGRGAIEEIKDCSDANRDLEARNASQT
jgi:hypothetical protein